MANYKNIHIILQENFNENAHDKSSYISDAGEVADTWGDIDEQNGKNRIMGMIPSSQHLMRSRVGGASKVHKYDSPIFHTEDPLLRKKHESVDEFLDRFHQHMDTNYSSQLYDDYTDDEYPSVDKGLLSHVDFDVKDSVNEAHEDNTHIHQILNNEDNIILHPTHSRSTVTVLNNNNNYINSSENTIHTGGVPIYHVTDDELNQYHLAHKHPNNNYSFLHAATLSAKHPNLNDDNQQNLMFHPNTDVRLALTQNQNLNKHTISTLAKDPDAQIRRALLRHQHPHNLSHVKTDLLNDPDDKVKHAAHFGFGY